MIQLVQLRISVISTKFVVTSTITRSKMNFPKLVNDKWVESNNNGESMHIQLIIYAPIADVR